MIAQTRVYTHTQTFIDKKKIQVQLEKWLWLLTAKLNNQRGGRENHIFHIAWMWNNEIHLTFNLLVPRSPLCHLCPSISRNGLTSYFFLSTCCFVFPEKYHYLTTRLNFRIWRLSHFWTQWDGHQIGNQINLLHTHMWRINTCILCRIFFFLSSQFTPTKNTVTHWFSLIITEDKRAAFPSLQLQTQLTWLYRYLMFF